MRLSKERKDEIKSIADQIRGEHHEEKLPPYDPAKIANSLNIKVELVRFKKENISAALLVDGDNAEIYIKGSDSPLRQNFSIAHELGHYCLHQKSFVDEPEQFWRAVDTKTEPEVEANEFAANLLMPSDIFMKRWEESNHSAEEMSEEFRVSVSAILYRAKNLNLLQ